MEQQPTPFGCPIPGCDFHVRSAGRELSAAVYQKRLEKHFRVKHKQLSLKRPRSTLESTDQREDFEVGNDLEPHVGPILGPEGLDADYQFMQQSLQLLAGAQWEEESSDEGGDGGGAWEREEEEGDDDEDEEEEEDVPIPKQPQQPLPTESPKIPAHIVLPPIENFTVPAENFIINEWDLYPGFGEFQKLKTISRDKFKQLQFSHGLTQEKQQEYITLVKSLGVKDTFQTLTELQNYQNAFLQTLPIHPLEITVTRKKFKETKKQTVGVHNVLDVIVDEYLEALDRKSSLISPGQVGDGHVISHLMNSKWGEKMKNHFQSRINQGFIFVSFYVYSDGFKHKEKTESGTIGLYIALATLEKPVVRTVGLFPKGTDMEDVYNKLVTPAAQQLEGAGITIHRRSGIVIKLIGPMAPHLGDRPVQVELIHLKQGTNVELPSEWRRITRPQLPVCNSVAALEVPRRSSQEWVEAMRYVAYLEEEKSKPNAPRGLDAEINKFVKWHGMVRGPISPLAKIPLFAESFLDMFPPDELHQEVHGNLVIHILAICNYMGDEFVEGLNSLVQKYPAFPGLRKFPRPPFYMLDSKKQGRIRKTTLNSAEEMEAFLAISPPLLFLLNVPGDVLRGWIAHIEAYKMITADTYNVNDKQKLEELIHIWMTSVQRLVQGTKEQLKRTNFETAMYWSEYLERFGPMKKLSLRPWERNHQPNKHANTNEKDIYKKQLLQRNDVAYAFKRASIERYLAAEAGGQEEEKKLRHLSACNPGDIPAPSRLIHSRRLTAMSQCIKLSGRHVRAAIDISSYTTSKDGKIIPGLHYSNRKIPCGSFLEVETNTGKECIQLRQVFDVPYKLHGQVRDYSVCVIAGTVFRVYPASEQCPFPLLYVKDDQHWGEIKFYPLWPAVPLMPHLPKISSILSVLENRPISRSIRQIQQLLNAKLIYVHNQGVPQPCWLTLQE